MFTDNVRRWHYLLTGPPQTPYAGGQYWGTLVFPPDYPFKPPAIRMLTPSGRFQTNTRLCLSISDFHPKSFNPAWEVSTILIGLLSFMTGDEMTTGSINMSEAERKALANRSRWWNSTGGGTCNDRGYIDLREHGWSSRLADRSLAPRGTSGVVRTGDGGARFREEFPDVDLENWKWMKERRVNLANGVVIAPEPAAATPASSKEAVAGGGEVRARKAAATAGAGAAASGAAATAGVVVKGGEGWIRRHKLLCAVLVLCGYVLLARFYE